MVYLDRTIAMSVTVFSPTPTSKPTQKMPKDRSRFWICFAVVAAAVFAVVAVVVVAAAIDVVSVVFAFLCCDKISKYNEAFILNSSLPIYFLKT